MLEATLPVQLEDVVRVCEKAANGDLEPRLRGDQADPELRRLVLALNHLLDMIDAYVRESEASLEQASSGRFHRRMLVRGMRGRFQQAARVINSGVERMGGQAKKLASMEEARLQSAGQVEGSLRRVSESVGKSAERIREMASELAYGAEEASDRSESVRKAAQQMSSSVNIVAAATGQLADAIGQVESKTVDSATMTQRAEQFATQTKVIMDEMRSASHRVGGVVKLISQIAEQTNLLALNAAIEAARSGAAGKGFAVVASEVKSLARKTGQSTEEISSEVQAIQKTAENAGFAIESICETIRKLTGIAGAISVGMNEQRAATSDINASIQAAARETQGVTQSIEAVSRSARKTTDTAAELLDASSNMSEHANELRRALEMVLATMGTATPA